MVKKTPNLVTTPKNITILRGIIPPPTSERDDIIFVAKDTLKTFIIVHRLIVP